MVWKITILVAYLIGLALIGVLASRRIRDISDFFVGGKKLGYWLVSFSSRATGESGWLLLGLTGMGYAYGVSAFWVVAGEMLGVSVCWVFLTQRFKHLTDMYDSITIPDYLESRFGDVGHALRALSAVVLAVFITAYVAAQFTAAGKAFESSLGLTYGWGVLLGMGVVAMYSVAGGFVAVVWSDFVQGLMMLAGLIVVPIAALFAVGGFEPLGESLRNLNAGMLHPMGSEGTTLRSVVGALGMLSIGFAYLGSPQLFVRFIAIKDLREIPRGAVVAIFYTALVGCGAVLAGMCGRVLLGLLDDKEHVLPEMSESLFPAAATGLLLAIILAAVMSTADSLLVLASSTLVRDIYQRILRPEVTNRALTQSSRWVTLGLAGIALVFALTESRVIFWFVLFAWAGIGSAFCPIIILSLFWKGLTRTAAICAMATGFIVTITWKTVPVSWLWAPSPLVEQLAPTDKPFSELVLADLVYEMLPAFFTAFAIAVGVSLMTRRPQNADEELDHLKTQVVDLWS